MDRSPACHVTARFHDRGGILRPAELSWNPDRIVKAPGFHISRLAPNQDFGNVFATPTFITNYPSITFATSHILRTGTSLLDTQTVHLCPWDISVPSRRDLACSRNSQ